ncbi:MAG: hypothetical protein Q9163_002220 [Psora crenata]
MAVHEGEERLLSVFADVHYYFNAPSPRPLSHRFDKSSYLYLYGNKSGSGGRLEIANNVGKAEQDAFTGALDNAIIRQSHKHPTLCTITVDRYQDERGTLSRPPEHYWKLPSGDPRNERPILFHLHTVDIYFWTVQDADSFVGCLRRLLQHDQVELLDIPPAPAAHEKVMSPVVQQLENLAIQDPAYQSGHSKNTSDTPIPVGSNETPKAAASATFQPLAYNPAAPAAPEPIRHREKTPPPVDADAGTGLAAAAYADQFHSQGSLSRPTYGQTSSIQPYIESPVQNPSTQPYIGSSPIQAPQSSFTSPARGSGAYTSPVSSTVGQRTSSVSSFQPPPSQSVRSSTNPRTPTPSFATPPQSPPIAESPSNQQLVNVFSPPPQDPHAPQYDQNGVPLPSPATQILGSSYVGGAHQPLQHVQPQYADYLGSTGHQSPGPVGGYSQYSYSQQQQSNQAPGNEYNVHSQAYRPTEEEAKKDKRHKIPDPGPVQQPGRFGQQAARVDKGVNRLFKKLEKRIG